MPLNRNQRKAETWCENVLLDRRFEMVAVGSGVPIRVASSFEPHRRRRIAQKPELHRPVVDSIGRAQKFSGRVSRVLVYADLFQDCLAACFIITMQNMLPETNIGSG